MISRKIKNYCELSDFSLTKKFNMTSGYLFNYKILSKSSQSRTHNLSCNVCTKFIPWFRKVILRLNREHRKNFEVKKKQH
jgi:hypothetical protein